MTTAATIGSMPRKRGTLTHDQKSDLEATRNAVEDSQDDYRSAVVRVLSEGASFAEVSSFTGLSTNTLQRWKREAGK